MKNMHGITTGNDTLAYRADIDGLRAVAILVVVLFHFSVPGFGGGFVGVDVFFVISGFLITSIVAGKVRDGTFSIAGFLERRIRRLMPTLFMVLLASLVVGLLVMTPSDLRRLAASGFNTLILGANVYFADQGGYFDGGLDEAPLLHVWSLAVEEQFYLVWPLTLLWLLSRRPTAIIPVTCALALASLWAAWQAADAFPVEGFYLPHTRAYELLTGCLLALGVVSAPRSRMQADVSSLVGIAMIGVAVAAYSDEMVMPGVVAVLPVAGTALVLWSGLAAPSLVGRTLSLRPLVFIGLVSYAWYLWHWPLLVFFRYVTERAPMAGEVVVLILLSFLLAVLSWRYVEVPVRARGGWLTREQLFFRAAAAASMLVVAIGATFFSEGFPNRFPPEVNALARGRIDLKLAGEACRKQSADVIRDGHLCMAGPASPDGDGILLWGDSHALALRPAFVELAESKGRQVTFAISTGCPPLLDAWPRQRGGRSERCAEFNTAVQELISTGRFGDVVIAARWNFYALGQPGDRTRHRKRFLEDGETVEPSVSESQAVIERGLKRTLNLIASSGARSWMVAEVPDMTFDVPGRMARRLIFGRPVDTIEGPARDVHLSRAHAVQEIIERVSGQVPVQLIDPSTVLCQASTCEPQADGQPLYSDNHHLSVFGARRVAPLFEPVFDNSVGADGGHAHHQRG